MRKDRVKDAVNMLVSAGNKEEVILMWTTEETGLID